MASGSSLTALLKTSNLVTTLATALIFVLGFLWLLKHLNRNIKVPAGLRLPPSPPGARFFGGHSHLWNGRPLSTPSKNQLLQWSKELGEIYHIRLGKRNWFVLSSREAVREVFDKNGTNSGSKEALIVANDVLSGGNRLIFMPYGKQWRERRAIVHQCLSVTAVAKLKPSQDLESRRYLYDVLVDSDNFMRNVQRYASSVILYALYGRQILTLDDPLMQEIFRSTARFAKVLGTRFLVDEYPILSQLPESLQWWRWKVDPWRKEGDAMMLRLWNELRSQFEKGIRTGCFVETFLESGYEKKGITELQAAWVAGSMIEAGSDTTQLTLNSIILGLLLYPDVVKKAHEELDRVVGQRMPDLADAGNLPYVRAIVKEALRWRSPTNDYTRHETTKDIIYKDYFIPAGSSAILNVWALHWDPEQYLDPEIFAPDRFLNKPSLEMTAGECINTSDVHNRDHYSFGAGRRVCPGYNLAENSLFLLTARLLWAFDVQRYTDPRTGVEHKYDAWAYPARRLYGPLPFPATFNVRDVVKEGQIRAGISAEEKRVADNTASGKRM
ncbi:cytochrome P450 [Pyrenochaeta sp. DS3sAY3a]|nr:cytochrome P450 [Pyrenochaeta sp. DS3sAY3a]